MPEKFLRVYLRKFENPMKCPGFQLVVHRHDGPDFHSLVNLGKADVTPRMPGNSKTKSITEDFYYLFTRYASMFWQPESPRTW